VRDVAAVEQDTHRRSVEEGARVAQGDGAIARVVREEGGGVGTRLAVRRWHHASRTGQCHVFVSGFSEEPSRTRFAPYVGGVVWVRHQVDSA
jgi:hypothetical protein